MGIRSQSIRFCTMQWHKTAYVNIWAIHRDAVRYGHRRHNSDSHLHPCLVKMITLLAEVPGIVFELVADTLQACDDLLGSRRLLKQDLEFVRYLLGRVYLVGRFPIGHAHGSVPASCRFRMISSSSAITSGIGTVSTGLQKNATSSAVSGILFA